MSKVKQYQQRGTVMFVTMQIILILNSTHKSVGGAELPDPYRGFMQTFRYAGVWVWVWVWVWV